MQSKDSMSEDLNEDQKNAYVHLQSKKNCFVSGEAGTGKSFLIKKYVENYQEAGELAITATTGISAATIGGQTIHSWAGIGRGAGTVAEIVKELRKSKNTSAKARWITCSVLLVDELSMLTGAAFDKLENIARILRHNELVFGGIIVKAFADFAQIEAIEADTEGYCFEAKCWSKVFPEVIELKQIMRQSDPVFTSILGKIRRGTQLSPEEQEILNKCKLPRNSPIEGLKPVMINSRKDIVEQLNMSELKDLARANKQPIIAFNAVVETVGTVEPSTVDNIMNHEISFVRELFLTIGANVVLIKNLDVENGICNGSRGVIRDFIKTGGIPSGVRVQFINGLIINITAEKNETRLPNNNKVIIHQLPLLLSWGLSGHRAQSLTLDYIKVGLNNCFANGQFYSIISRCRSLDGLVIDNIDFTKIMVSDKVKRFYGWI